MVRLGVPGGDPSALAASEAVGITLPASGWADEALEVAKRCHALVVGPGLGRAEATEAGVRAVVASSPVPVVVDADGLNALGRIDAPLAARSAVVLTPHDGEYARLMGEAPGPDRIAAARRLATASGAVALLKGATTAVADPSGRVLLARAGTPSLATAGTGDVLSGSHRRPGGPGCASARGRRHRRPRARPGRVARPPVRAWWPVTCRTWWPGCSTSLGRG